MGRRAEGWKLRSRGKSRHFTVRFWLGGREIERSCGSSDPQRAAKEAARIYAAEVGRAENRPKRRSVSGHTLEELLALWIEALKSTHAAGTVDTWKMYAYAHWAPHFDAPHHINDLMCVEYMRARLLVVQGETVRKELTALRQFISWCTQLGFVPPGVKVPSVPKRSLGTVFADKPKRKAAIEVSPVEVEKIIALLPQWSASRKVKRFPIRARFVVGYDTSLRPSTLDKLLTPIHYRPKQKTIRMTPDIDKGRFGREVPLTERARVALDAVLPDEPGVIFGKHDYREHIWEAAKTVLGEARAEEFCAAHLRSARITHLLERTHNMAGVQHLAGHLRTTTTARYVRPTLRAAQDVIRETESAPRAKRRAV